MPAKQNVTIIIITGKSNGHFHVDHVNQRVMEKDKLGMWQIYWCKVEYKIEKN